jgi:hypothetical protein
MVGLATLRLSTSPLHRHCYSSPQDELRTRITGQRACAPALQPGQRAHLPCRYSGAWVRGCARTHPGSARASCVPQLHPPSACPAILLVLPLSFGQLAKILPPTVQPTPQCFQVPTDSRGLWGAHEQYLSNPWAPLHADLCMWKPERRSFTHSRSHARSLEVRFFLIQSETSRPYKCGGVGLTQQIA